MNCIHLRNRIKESEKERDMPLYRIGQAWIPSLVIRVSFCLLIVVQPSLAINSSTRPTIIKPVKRRQILVRHPSPPPTRFFSHAEDNSREYIYIYILTLNRSWRVFVEKLLEPVAAGRASFRSIAYALYKPTKRFYLFFLSPPSRASFVSTNRQRSPLFIYTAAADVSLLLLICPVYTRIIHVYVSPAARARPFRTPVRRNRGQHALVSTAPRSRVAPPRIFRARIYRRERPRCTPRKYVDRWWILRPPLCG